MSLTPRRRALLPVLLIVCVSLSTLSLPSLLVGQTPATSSGPVPAAALAALPVPVVTAGFPAPAHPVDWSHYTDTDACVGVLAWTQAEAAYDRFDRTLTLDTQRRFDTTLANPWAPLSTATRDSTLRCLTHVPHTALPAFEAPAVLRLAVTLNADSLLTGLLASRLAAVQGAPVPAQAAVLDTLIQLLMDSPGLPAQPRATQPSPAHLQQARTYAAQLVALGPAALPMRINANYALNRPAEFTFALDAMLADNDTLQHLLRQLPPAEFHQIYSRSLETIELGLQGEAAQFQWLATHAPAALARFRETAAKTQDVPPMEATLLGTPAAAVTGDYCFATPTTSTPTAGLTPAVPTPGVPSLVVVRRSTENWPTREVRLFAMLRRVHQEFPTLRIVLLAPLTGAYQGRWLQDQPAQEARLWHQELADSLGVPGSLCLWQPHYQALPNGWAQPLSVPLQRAYDLDVDGEGSFLIDPQGIFTEVLFARDYYRDRTLLRLWQQRRSGDVTRAHGRAGQSQQ